MPRPSSTLDLGDRAPDFALPEAQSGREWTLAQLLANRRGLLLVFHRGLWCPSCRGQLAELAEQHEPYAREGIGAAAVLAQARDRAAAALERSGARYPFPLLCDGARTVVRRYGVWHPIGVDSFNTAHPASLLIESATGTIRYAFVGTWQFQRAPLGAMLGAARNLPQPPANV